MNASVAPEGLAFYYPDYPPLKRWAIIFRPAQRDSIVALPGYRT